jgi:DNA-binding transcriptional regulator YdaS (Cro superfamily)
MKKVVNGQMRMDLKLGVQEGTLLNQQAQKRISGGNIRPLLIAWFTGNQVLKCTNA